MEDIFLFFLSTRLESDTSESQERDETRAIQMLAPIRGQKLK